MAFFSKNKMLELEDKNLEELPPLPPGLIKLYCGGNRLTSLPPLPATLEILSCGENQLTELPPLPAGLKVLFCERNQLTSLPQLPVSLTELDCEYNNGIISLYFLVGLLFENTAILIFVSFIILFTVIELKYCLIKFK